MQRGADPQPTAFMMPSESPDSSQRKEDFDLVDGMMVRIESFYGFDRLNDWDAGIPLERRVVHFTWSATGYAGSEGYAPFLALECRHSALAECFREVGLPELAAVMDEMLAPVPAGALGDDEALARHFGSWQACVEWTAPFQKTLYKAADRIPGALAAYIRAHVPGFVELSPELGAALAAQP